MTDTSTLAERSTPADRDRAVFGGIDAGSRAIKVVLIREGDHAVLARGLRDQGVEQDRMARELFESLLESEGIASDRVRGVVATGYGRNRVEMADRAVTEITCHAAGVTGQSRGVRTVIEIGGQDSKVLLLDEAGKVRDFAMNDRCAAGTGRFLEMVANRINVSLSRLGEAALKSAAPATISSMCVVFAETEIVGLLADGTAPEDIVAGVQHSIATRVCAMVGRRAESPVCFTGGGALVGGMKAALAGVLGREVVVAEHPQYTGALGAALIAARD